jgi:hypothetical protein
MRFGVDKHFIGNIDYRLRKYITQANKTTGGDVHWEWGAVDIYGRPVKGCVAVYTNDIRKDQGGFWAEYHRLIEKES